MSHTFVLDEGVVISAHTGIDPSTDQDSDEAYRLIRCIAPNGHRLAWCDEAWQKYRGQLSSRRFRDTGWRPYVFQLLLALFANSDTNVLVEDSNLRRLEYPDEMPNDDHLWVHLMMAASALLATTDRRLQRAVRSSAHYAAEGARMHLVPEALPLACAVS